VSVSSPRSIVPPALPPPQAPPLAATVDEAPAYGRSIKLSPAAVDQVIRRRALTLLRQKGFGGDKLDFMLRAKIHRSTNGGATVTWEE